jgi:large subunit ribosomal protein L6
MSRIGKLPVTVPDKVDVRISGPAVAVKGPLGQLERTFRGVTFNQDGKVIRVVPDGEDRGHRALWGLSRTLLHNMVQGVSKGYEKVLEINGVGYRAEAKGRQVLFTLGYSHPIEFDLPAGITVEVEKQTIVKVKGADKEVVGQVAAQIRALRPPEPYKGKGIKYASEVIKKKAGKAAG